MKVAKEKKLTKKKNYGFSCFINFIDPYFVKIISTTVCGFANTLFQDHEYVQVH